MKRFACVLDDSLDARFRSESERSGVPQSEMARRAIAAYLRMNDAERMAAYVAERQGREKKD